MSDETEPADEEQRPEHLFKPGQSGNPKGRPKGSRNKLGEDFLKALAEDFSKHGVAAIKEVRTDKPDQYLKVIASLMPKDVNLEVSASEQFQEVLEALNTKASHGLAKRISRQRQRSEDIRH